MSTQHMDETTIITKQNRCFMKDLVEYEEAIEAKINYKKTNVYGMTAGKHPIENIEWCSLGIFFGNDNP